MVDLSKNIKDNLIRIKVIPNSSRTHLIIEDNKVKVYLKSVPDKNKANQELIKYLKKEYGLKAEIKSGLRSRDKVLKIINNFLWKF